MSVDELQRKRNIQPPKACPLGQIFLLWHGAAAVSVCHRFAVKYKKERV